MKTNRFLDVHGMGSGDAGGGSNDQRRFSLRNFFSKPSGFFSTKSSQSNLNKRNSEPENYLLQLLQENQNQQQHQQNLIMNVLGQTTSSNGNNIAPKIVNSHCSMSNSSSLTSASVQNQTTAQNREAGSASFKILPVSSVTGSVLKFHRNKLSDKFNDRSSGRSDTSTTEPTTVKSRTLSDPNMNKIRYHENSNSLKLPIDDFG